MVNIHLLFIGGVKVTQYCLLFRKSRNLSVYLISEVAGICS